MGRGRTIRKLLPLIHRTAATQNHRYRKKTDRERSQIIKRPGPTRSVRNSVAASLRLRSNYINKCVMTSFIFVVLAKITLSSTFDYIVMQMRKINHEKGYSQLKLKQGELLYIGVTSSILIGYKRAATFACSVSHIRHTCRQYIFLYVKLASYLQTIVLCMQK